MLHRVNDGFPIIQHSIVPVTYVLAGLWTLATSITADVLVSLYWKVGILGLTTWDLFYLFGSL